MSGKHSKKPLPSFFGPTLPLDIDIHHDEDGDMTPSRRAAGPIVFHDEPLLKTSPGDPAKSDVNTNNTRPSKMKLQATTTVPPVSDGWNYKLLQDIPALPAYFTLEPTAVFVPNASATCIADRIVSVLRERSIETRFHNAKATCNTLEGVEFGIRLYRGRERYSHGIIVEVQRREGTSLRFHEDAQAILDAAENKSRPKITATANHLPPVVVSDTEDEYDDRSSNSSNSSVLDLVSRMLQHPGTQRLALETLVTFTDTSKMDLSTARTVSRQLLQPGNSVGAKIVSLVIYNNKGLRVLAMEALGNALQNTSHATSLPQDKLRSVFYQDLVDCEKNTRVAYMAARCLEYLFNGYDAGMYQALQDCVAVGNAKHAALAQQAAKCLDRL